MDLRSGSSDLFFAIGHAQTRFSVLDLKQTNAGYFSEPLGLVSEIVLLRRGTHKNKKKKKKETAVFDSLIPAWGNQNSDFFLSTFIFCSPFSLLFTIFHLIN